MWKEGKLALQNGMAGPGTDQNSTSDPETSLDASASNGTDPVKTPLLSSNDLNGSHKNGGTPSGNTFVPSTTTVKREPSQLTAKPVNIDASPKKKKTNGCCSVM